MSNMILFPFYLFCPNSKEESEKDWPKLTENGYEVIKKNYKRGNAICSNCHKRVVLWTYNGDGVWHHLYQKPCYSYEL